MEIQTKTKIKLSVFFVVLLVVAIGLFMSFTAVPTGYRGVVTNFGKVVGIRDEGVSMKAPWYDVTMIKVRETKNNYKFDVSSKDIQTISIDISNVYSLNKTSVNKIYQDYGADIVRTLMEPTLAEVVNQTVSEYTIEEFISKRDEISDKIQERFITRVKDEGVIVKSISLVNHDFSDNFDKAIEEKKVAEQKALTAKNKLETVKYEAQANIEEAKGTAKAQALKNKTLTTEIIQEQFIKKWDGKLPSYMGGNGDVITNLVPKK